VPVAGIRRDSAVISSACVPVHAKQNLVNPLPLRGCQFGLRAHSSNRRKIPLRKAPHRASALLPRERSGYAFCSPMPSWFQRAEAEGVGL